VVSGMRRVECAAVHTDARGLGVAQIQALGLRKSV
jgi:hypothetical protein